MRFGVHVSIAGGLHNALLRGLNLGCDTIQFFLVNPRGWSHAPLLDSDVERFLAIRNSKAKEIHPLIAHMPYLPNLAASDSELFLKSVDTLQDHLERCKALQIDFLVLHMGKGKGRKAIDRMLKGIEKAYQGNKYETCLLLENTAGQGNDLGFHIQELSELFTKLPKTISKGICLDTCHAFAAGYDLSTKKGILDLIQEFDQSIGFKEVKILHINDSLKPIGSRVDRHAKIGEGYLGEDGFRNLFSIKQLRKLPCILENPRKTDADDLAQLELVRRLSS